MESVRSGQAPLCHGDIFSSPLWIVSLSLVTGLRTHRSTSGPLRLVPCCEGQRTNQGPTRRVRQVFSLLGVYFLVASASLEVIGRLLRSWISLVSGQPLLLWPPRVRPCLCRACRSHAFFHPFPLSLFFFGNVFVALPRLNGRTKASVKKSLWSCCCRLEEGCRVKASRS